MNILVLQTLKKLEKINDERYAIILKTGNLDLYKEWQELNKVIAEGYAILAERIADKVEELENAETNYSHAYQDTYGNN